LCQYYTPGGPYCEQQKCQNGGTCREIEASLESEESFFCTCHEGWHGTLCQLPDNGIPYCEQMKCQNGGTCLEIEAPKESEESFQCFCKAGWTGRLCHTKVTVPV